MHRDIKIMVKNNEAILKIKSATNKLVDYVAMTYGPQGKNVLVGRRHHLPVVANDGVFISKRVVLQDEVEDTIAQYINQAAVVADNYGGDGTTTTMILLRAIVNSVFKDVTEDSLVDFTEDVINIKNELLSDLQNVVTSIQTMSKEVKTKEDIYNVAFVASESEEIAHMVAEILDVTGFDVALVAQNSNNNRTTFEITKGYRIEIPIPFPAHFANQINGTAIHENIPVIVTNRSVETYAEITDIVKYMNKENISDIILFCEGFNLDSVKAIVQMKEKKGKNIIPLIVSGYEKGDRFEDIVAVTQATLIDISKNQTLSGIDDYSSIVGYLDKATLRAKDSILYSKNNKESVEKLVSKLEQRLTENKELTAHQKEKLKKRISNLKFGVAFINVGAESLGEQEYIKLKIDDTIKAVEKAIDGGVVPGAGKCLALIADTMNEKSKLKNALYAPSQQIKENGVGNVISESIVDPALIVINSLTKAVSVASILITTGGIIAYKDQKEEPEQDVHDDDESRR